MRALLFCLFFTLNCFALNSDKDTLEKKYEYYFQNLKNSRELGNEKQMLHSAQKAIYLAELLGSNPQKGKIYIALGNYYYDKNESSPFAYDYYYRGLREYSKDKDSIKMAKTLLRLAILEKNTRSYLKSKESCFKALELLNNKETDFLESIYNNLGIVYNELKDVKSSVFYHQKALELRSKNNEQELILQSYNNIGTCYLENGFLKKAKSFYAAGLGYPKQILEYFPKEYSRLLDNNAYLKLLQGERDVLEDLLKALAIRDSINHQAGIVTSCLHLATYYQGMDDTKTSDFYASKAYRSAFANKNYGDALLCLVVLESNSQKKGDYKKALEYARQYNRFVDYLAKEELKIDEKFAEIRYQAKQKENENKILRFKNQQQEIKRKKYLKIVTGLFAILLASVMVYVQFSKIKRKEQERKATEQIMQLLYEKQQALENVKDIEQKRIANDLHDSVAGKLSGLMLKLDTIAVGSPKELKDKLDPAVKNLEDILKELILIVHDMNDRQVVKVSYLVLIKELVHQFESRSTTFSSTIDTRIDWDKISNRVKLTIYYVLQQALRNIVEHSKASKTTVQIDIIKEFIQIAVSDDGRGFKEDKPSGMGILGMRKRIQEVGGDFIVDTAINSGTTIKIKIPIS